MLVFRLGADSKRCCLTRLIEAVGDNYSVLKSVFGSEDDNNVTCCILGDEYPHHLIDKELLILKLVQFTGHLTNLSTASLISSRWVIIKYSGHALREKREADSHHSSFQPRSHLGFTCMELHVFGGLFVVVTPSVDQDGLEYLFHRLILCSRFQLLPD